MNISIDPGKCTQCGKCITLCPAYVFDRVEKRISVVSSKNCIECSHCVAACSPQALNHSSFPYSMVKPIDFSELPSPQQVMLLLQARRSNRAVVQTPVAQSVLQEIVDAGLLAPTASNSRSVKALVVTDAKVLKQVADATVDVYRKWHKQLSNPLLKPILKLLRPKDLALLPAFEKLIAKYDSGDDVILRNMTSLIFFYAPKRSRFGVEDANLAYQNASIYATAKGVAHLYTGYVCAADRAFNGISKLLGVDGKIYAGMALANAKFQIPNYVDRSLQS